MLVPATDAVGSALRSALDGLAYRQRVSANNVANVDTPGFTASTVDFEDSLRGALADGTYTPGEAAPDHDAVDEPGRCERQQRRPRHRDA